MVQAYILIQTEVRQTKQVASEVAGIAGIVRVDTVTGPYDVIALAEAPTIDDMAETVFHRIQLIDGITRTVTCSVVHL